MKKLTIDTEFYNLTVPITDQQQEQLEESILRNGCIEPIITWDGVIIDGHKRYLICCMEAIEFETEEVEFPSRTKAMAWICRKRIGSLKPGTPIDRYLHGKWYVILKSEYRKLLEKGTIGFPEDPDGRVRISKVIAQDLGIRYTKVESYCGYANTMDKIARSDQDIFRAIVEKRIKLTLKETRMLARGDRKMKRAVREKLDPGPDPEMKPRRGRPRKTEASDGIALQTKIKEMPVFDPDMEIRGLSLTIPTWMTAIARAEKKTDMELATEHARRQLADSLLRLEKQIQETLEALGCTEKDF